MYDQQYQSFTPTVTNSLSLMNETLNKDYPPVLAVQIFLFFSKSKRATSWQGKQAAAAIHLPLGDHAKQATPFYSTLLKEWRSLILFVSQTWMSGCLPISPVTTLSLSGCNAIAVMSSVWSSKKYC